MYGTLALTFFVTGGIEEALDRATEAAARFSEPPRGEITLVFGPGEPGLPDVDEAAAAVAELVAAGVPRRRAAEIVARLTGASRNELYRRTL